jgi:replicative DNA helicase
MALNSEYCLLGIVLNNQELFPKIIKNIFLNTKCNELYNILSMEWKRSKGFTKENVLELIKNNTKINEDDFYEIYDSALYYDQFDQYYNFVMSNWAVIYSDKKIKELRLSKYTSIVDVKIELQKIIHDLSIDDEKEIKHSQDTALKIITDIGQGKQIKLIKSHIKYIDNYGGLENGDLIIIAARPAIGKSSRIYNMMIKDINFNIFSVLFTLEASKEKVLRLMGCIASGVDSTKLRLNKLNDQEKKTYIEGYNKIYDNLPIIDDSVTMLESIKIRSKIMKDKYDIKKIYIDYLGLIETNEGRNRYEKVSFISRELKKLAMDLGIPIIALHQLNRASESRSDNRPRMSDLRDSGSIEQDADGIILLNQIINDMNTKDEVVLEHIIEKFREGATGISKSIFQKNTRRIKDWTD